MAVSPSPRPVPPRDNPFRSGCVDELGYVSPTGEPLASIIERVRAANFRGALVGPHGHGKSTLMRQLATLDPPEGAERHPVVQVMADGSNRAAVREAIFSKELAKRLFLDGFDLLPWALRRAVMKRGQAFVTSHRSTRLPTILRCHTTPALLGELVRQLSPAVREALSDWAMVELHTRHAGNVRNALRELYDRVAAGEFEI